MNIILLITVILFVSNNVLCADTILYLLFTNAKPNGEYVTPDNIQTSSFNRSNELKFVLHGYSSNITNDDILAIKNSFLTIGGKNVFLVDWTVYSDGNSYVTPALINTRIAGDLFGDFLISIKNKLQLSLDSYHLIGHSLGAQMAGFAARKMIAQTGGIIRRITALDAAKPLFEVPPLLPSLKKSDARFIDSIHSEVGLKGYLKPFAHVDFYPNNGGPLQPGCVGPLIGDTCSHHRSVYYFAESIVNNKFVARRCCSWNKYINGKCNNSLKANMGYYVPENVRGVFFLRTNDQPNYALG